MVQYNVLKYIHYIYTNLSQNGGEIMVSTVFSDFIVNATDLRNNQKQWLERAYSRPITVSYGRRQLAIMNREQVGKLYTAKYYSELVLKACQEFMEKNKSDTFPWVEFLSDDERMQFYNELLKRTMRSFITGNWSQLENLIQDWKATAEVESNPELAKALTAEEDSSQYVEIKE